MQDRTLIEELVKSGFRFYVRETFLGEGDVVCDNCGILLRAVEAIEVRSRNRIYHFCRECALKLQERRDKSWNNL